MTREPDLPDFSAVRNLLLEVAQEPTLDAVIQRMVEGICAARPYVVRACIWLVDDQEPELVLAASARKNRDESGPEWTHDSGDFRRVPFTEPLIGQVVETADPRLAAGEEDWPGGLPDWARREGISLSVAQAIVFRGKALGVLAVFAGAAQGQESVVEEALIWLRIFADHGAAAIANAQAFQEIERLRRQLSAPAP